MYLCVCVCIVTDASVTGLRLNLSLLLARGGAAKSVMVDKEYSNYKWTLGSFSLWRRDMELGRARGMEVWEQRECVADVKHERAGGLNTTDRSCTCRSCCPRGSTLDCKIYCEAEALGMLYSLYKEPKTSVQGSKEMACCGCQSKGLSGFKVEEITPEMLNVRSWWTAFAPEYRALSTHQT